MGFGVDNADDRWDSLAQHHRGDGPTASLGHVSMGKEQRAVCSVGLVIEVAVLLRLGLILESERG